MICVGTTPMNLDRRAFFEKEFDLRLSMSCSPGRCDRRDEEVGLDYLGSYARRAENRNLQSFLDLPASGAIDPGWMDVQTVAFAEAARSGAVFLDPSEAP